jgi:hypothetical protein
MYNTPELLLVGAAQQLVLGESPAGAGSEIGDCVRDEFEVAPFTYYDEAAW